MKFIKTGLCELIISMTLVGCAFDPKQKAEVECILEIENKTDETLYVYISNYDSLKTNSKTVSYNDELFTNDICYNESDTSSHQKYRLLPQAKTYFYGNKEWLPYKVTNRIYFFFIKEKNIKIMKWENIANKQQYELKLSYTFEEIEKQHFRIIYDKQVHK